jgi:DHA2 family multidrug resistance protein
VARLIQSVGLPFLFVPISAMAYVGLAPKESNQASAMMNVARNLGGTIGIATVQIVLAQREQFHQSRLVEGVNPLNPNYAIGLERLTQGLIGQGQSPTDAQPEALATIYGIIQRQAAMLSFLDVFHVLLVAVLAVIPLLLLVEGQKGGAPQGHAA